MRTFRIGFSKSTLKLGFFSWLIQWYEKTPFSHTFVEYNTVHHLGSDTIYQSSRGMVNNMSKDVFLEENEITHVFTVTCGDEIYKEMRNGLHSVTGKHYGFMQNIGIIISDIFKIKNPFKKGYNCSELVYEKVLKKLFPELEYNKDNVTPKMVYLILKENKDALSKTKN